MALVMCLKCLLRIGGDQSAPGRRGRPGLAGGVDRFVSRASGGSAPGRRALPAPSLVVRSACVFASSPAGFEKMSPVCRRPGRCGPFPPAILSEHVQLGIAGVRDLDVRSLRLFAVCVFGSSLAVAWPWGRRCGLALGSSLWLGPGVVAVGLSLWLGPGVVAVGWCPWVVAVGWCPWVVAMGWCPVVVAVGWLWLWGWGWPAGMAGPRLLLRSGLWVGL